jgi:hypothetical protein
MTIETVDAFGGDGRDDPADVRRVLDDTQGLPETASASGGAAFEGARAFADALHAALRHAADHGTRRVCWCDPDFAAWPLGNAAWMDTLTRWARLGGRELVMIAGDYAAIERLHPRFVAWRRDWAHVVKCLVPDESRTAALPTLWLDSADQAIRVFDPEHWRGRAGFDRVDRQRAREDFDAIAQRANPGFAAVTLGL